MKILCAEQSADYEPAEPGSADCTMKNWPIKGKEQQKQICHIRKCLAEAGQQF
jgi:hypothetical protein